MTVLIVDDAAFMRLRLKKMIEAAGYQVIEADNGQKAVQIYHDRHPDLVLMDITMPEMDGITALKIIREEDPQAKVLMVSALGQQNMVISAIQAGAKDFIVKPYEPERIINALKKWGTS
ncbi:MAG: response regulator [Firmicutes bacterium]|nr:response regulator [Bacillota bacterium]